MKYILFIIGLFFSNFIKAEGYQEPLYRAWLLGASFSISPVMQDAGPRLGQQISALGGNHGITVRGDSGYSALELYQEGKYLLDKYGNDPADFLIVDLTGSVFYEKDNLLFYIKELINLYQLHPIAKNKTVILVNEYPPYESKNWFTDLYLTEIEYNKFKQQFNYIVETSGAYLIPAWEHFRSSEYPHPDLEFKPDYHPTGNSSRRAALTLLYYMENIWACKIQSNGTSISKSLSCQKN